MVRDTTTYYQCSLRHTSLVNRISRSNRACHHDAQRTALDREMCKRQTPELFDVSSIQQELAVHKTRTKCAKKRRERIPLEKQAPEQSTDQEASNSWLRRGCADGCRSSRQIRTEYQLQTIPVEYKKQTGTFSPCLSKVSVYLLQPARI